MNDNTIAAISTAYGEAGIGIVRMSGDKALNILTSVFKNKNGGDISFQPRHMYYGKVKDPETDTVIDEALAVFMKAPYTYTGEDVCEIQCHGGNFSTKEILALLLRQGAVLAERGEFTKRAFLSGKIDLTKAEAVIDLIKAKATKSYDAAVSQMQGSVQRKVTSIRSKLMDVLVNLTVNMDYPDEDIEVLTYDNFRKALNEINTELLSLNASAREGRIIREGLRVCIVGKPNVGKSSLMNLFLHENRSIVTDIPGTTRDTIEECASVRGIPVSFIDTAGIHDSNDVVESLGIERSKDAFNKADLIILVLDGSNILSPEDKELLSMAEGRPYITVINKKDLGLVTDVPGIKTSFKTGEGLSQIEDAIEEFVDGGKVRREEDLLVTNVRHQELLRKAQNEISEALNMIKNMEAMDFIEVNVKAAFDYLGEIIGETASDTVLNEVFSRFCLGK